MADWLPSDDAGLRAWFRADAITGLSNADPVAQWDDASGLGNHATQGTAGNRPTYRTNLLNGLPGVRFDGTDDVLSFGASASSRDEFAIAVWKPAAVASVYTLLGASANGGRQWRLNNGDLEWLVQFVGGNQHGTALTNLTTSAWAISSINVTAAEVSHQSSGERQRMASADSLTAGLTSKLGEGPGGEYLNGDVLELIVAGGQTLWQRLRYEGYLAHKYRLTLPVGHPFRSNAPQSWELHSLPTRLYLPSPVAGVNAPAISPAFAAEWDDASAGDRVLASFTKSNTAMADKSSSDTTAASNRDSLMRQYHGPPLPAGWLRGSLKGRVRVIESNAANNMRTQAVVRVVSADGATVRGTLYAGDLGTQTGNPTSEWSATASTVRQIPRGANGVLLTPVLAQDGDVPLIELGSRKHAAASVSGTMRFGDTGATDFPENESATADNVPWIEFVWDPPPTLEREAVLNVYRM